MLSSHTNKQQIRTQLIAKRKQLASAQAELLSKVICQKTIGYINWQRVKTLHIYQTIPENKEVDTKDIIKHAQNLKIKIKYPEPDKPPTGSSFDLVIVPMVGFDVHGNRLGFGGGYYDRFVAGNKINQTLGLAYSFQQTGSIPASPQDKKIPVIITEKEIIKAS